VVVAVALAWDHTGTGRRVAQSASEAVLLDHDTMTVAALDPADDRSIDVEVAGVASLLVAKAHKDFTTGNASGPASRLHDKDASDVVRHDADLVAAYHRCHPWANSRTSPCGEATTAALEYFEPASSVAGPVMASAWHNEPCGLPFRKNRLRLFA